MNKAGIKVVIKLSIYITDWSKEVLDLCKEFKGEGVVGIDLAGQEFHPGADPDECAHKKAFAVSYLCFVVTLRFFAEILFSTQ